MPRLSYEKSQRLYCLEINIINHKILTVSLKFKLYQTENELRENSTSTKFYTNGRQNYSANNECGMN